MTRTTIAALASVWSLALPATTFAQSYPELPSDDAVAQDDLDDLIGDDDDDESTVREERRALEDEVERETVQVELPPAKKKVIKTLQRKEFLKLGRGEGMVYAAYVPNDPWVWRAVFGGSIAYHVTEIFAVEINGGYAPRFGEGVEAADLKPITKRLYTENSVSPVVSRYMWHTTANVMYSPLYGKIANPKSAIAFDLYGVFGVGVAGVQDDLFFQAADSDDPELDAKKNQVVPAMSLGGGFRMAFNNTVALRFEFRSLSYINTALFNDLEVKSNATISLGVSFFFGGGK